MTFNSRLVDRTSIGDLKLACVNIVRTPPSFCCVLLLRRFALVGSRGLSVKAAVFHLHLQNQSIKRALARYLPRSMDEAYGKSPASAGMSVTCAGHVAAMASDACMRAAMIERSSSSGAKLAHIPCDFAQRGLPCVWSDKPREGEPLFRFRQASSLREIKP